MPYIYTMIGLRGRYVTRVDCQCGHYAVLPYVGLAQVIVPRLRCTVCGAKGKVAVTLQLANYRTFMSDDD